MWTCKILLSPRVKGFVIQSQGFSLSQSPRQISRASTRVSSSWSTLSALEYGQPTIATMLLDPATGMWSIFNGGRGGSCAFRRRAEARIRDDQYCSSSILESGTEERIPSQRVVGSIRQRKGKQYLVIQDREDMSLQ